MLAIDRNSSVPFYQQIYKQLASAIEEGLYHPGEQLPSLRQTAQTLSVSRNTVEQAYLLLTQEGYVDARPGSGYVVNKRDAKPQRIEGFDADYEQSLSLLRERSRSARANIAYDFAYDAMDAQAFPYINWASASREVLQGIQAENMCRYADPRGLPELRLQIAEYLMREEDIQAIPEQILILPTTRIAMSVVLQLFERRKTTVAVEDPCFPEIVHICREWGYAISPHSVYPENSWKTFATRDYGTCLVYCTPSNQYPTNQIMKLDDRKALVKWASENNGYIIEDAYCHEFRYKGDHLPSLHALDTEGRVIVMGTFSKSIAPSLCICYLVLPPELMLRWQDSHSMMHAIVSWQTQATLAEFIRQGHWYQHLHRIQTLYRRKYHEVVESLNDIMGNRVDYLDYENGLHVLLTTRDGRSAGTLCTAAEKAGVRLYRTEQDFIGDVPKDWRYLLLGYGAIPLEKIRPGIEALARAWDFL